jgi:hypothetical protein
MPSEAFVRCIAGTFVEALDCCCPVFAAFQWRKAAKIAQASKRQQ